MLLRIVISIMFCGIFNEVYSQLHQPVFSSLTEEELLESLVISYKPNLDLTQAMSRDTLFGNIDSPNDSLTCVYSGFKIWLDPTDDPTQAAFMGGGPNAINTEHTFPKSLGATGLAEGDMHNLYATRADVNQARANLPFGEIEDSQVETWYYLNQSQSTIPTQDIDLYSERTDAFFEVPEAHKGNVARSMFYFYTMYKEQADMADATFFENQRITFCQWHLLDPVDQEEWNRTFHIAAYQDGKPNPFVLDCTLPERSYCINFGQKCEPVSADEAIETSAPLLFKNEPNPFYFQTKIRYRLDQQYKVKVLIFNNLGQRVSTLVNQTQSKGDYEIIWEKPAQNLSGTFFCHLILQDNSKHYSAIQKMIILPE